MKKILTYLFIVLFTFVFSYKTIRHLAKAMVAEIAYCEDMDCENEKEKSIEKDEITDYLLHPFSDMNHLLLLVQPMHLRDLLVHFYSSDYSNAVFSPPELLS